jgi:hypothetical protein
MVDYNVASNFNIDVGHPKFNDTTLTKIVKSINTSSNLDNTSNFYLKFKNTIHSFWNYLKSNFHDLLVFFIFLIWNLIGKSKKRVLLLVSYSYYSCFFWQKFSNSTQNGCAISCFGSCLVLACPG